MDVLNPGAGERHAIRILDDNRIATHDGRRLLIIDTTDRTNSRLLDSADSIGSIAISDDRSLLATGGKSINRSPSITIYNTATFTPIAILQNSASRTYTALDFNNDATILASVSGDPDHVLTLWNWKSGDIILRAKSFSQDVFKVAFSRKDPCRLTTCGTGHIKFWTVADTFTGMKLQGGLGKFGRLELTDICDFAELPKGYTVSGTESGLLLLWKDFLIKAIVHGPDGCPCHTAAVNVIHFDEESSQLISASADGWIKVWDTHVLISEIEMLDRFYEPICTTPISSLKLNEADLNGMDQLYGIASMMRQADQWILSLTSGGIVQLPVLTPSRTDHHLKHLWEYPAGGIAGMDLFQNSNAIVTAATNGTVALFDARQRRLRYQSAPFSASASCVAVIPVEVDGECLSCLVGFEDGTVRRLKRCLDGWKLTAAMRPHKFPITFFAFSETMAVSCCKDGRMFFYSVIHCGIEPIGFATLAGNAKDLRSANGDITSGCFDTSGEFVIVGTQNGKLLKVTTTPPLTTITTRQHSDHGYQINSSVVDLDLRTCNNTLLPCYLRSLEMLIDEPEWNFSIVAVQALSEQCFLIACSSALKANIYEISLDDVTCRAAVQMNDLMEITCMQLIKPSNALVLGSATGEVFVMTSSTTSETQSLHWTLQSRHSVHDCEKGSISSVRCLYDTHCIVSAAENGTLVTTVQHRAILHHPTLHIQMIEKPSDWLEDTVPSIIQDDDTPIVDDIIGVETFSLDEAQSKEMEKCAQEQAEQKKRRIRDYLEDLRNQLHQLKKENNQRSRDLRLPDDAFIIDTNLQMRMQEELDNSKEQVKNKYAYDLEKEYVALKKLERKFFIPVKEHTEAITAIASPLILSSFVLKSAPTNWKEKQEEKTASRNDKHRKTEEKGHPSDGCDEKGKTVGERTIDMSMTRSEHRKRREKLIKDHDQAKPKTEDKDYAKIKISREARESAQDFELKTCLTDIVLEQRCQATPAQKEDEIFAAENEGYRLQLDFNRKFRELQEYKERTIHEINQCNAYLDYLRNRIQLLAPIQSHGQTVDCVSGRSDLFHQPCTAQPQLLDSEQRTIKNLAIRVRQSLKQVERFLATQEVTSTPTNAFPSPGERDREHASSKTGRSVQVEGNSIEFYDNLSILHLLCEHKRLQQRKRQLALDFDRELEQLCLKRLDIECSIAYKNMLRSVLIRELECLSSNRPAEVDIEHRLASKQTEVQCIRDRFKHCSFKLESLAAETADSLEAKNDLQQKFDRLVPHSHPLHYVYRRLLGKKDDATQLVGSKPSSDDSDSDVSFDDANFSDDLAEETDKELVLKVLNLREENHRLKTCQHKRAKEMETLKKDKDLHQKKLKVLEGSLTTLQSEMNQCRAEKQKQLNAIHTCVVLKPSQIMTTQLQTNSLLHQDVVLMDRAMLNKLAQRPRELGQQIADLTAERQSLKQYVHHLKQDRATKTTNLTLLRQRLEEMQLLKFGQILDLDVVDAIQAAFSQTHAPNQTTSENAQEDELRQTLAQLEKKTTTVSREISQLTEQSTELLTKVSAQRSKQLQFERFRIKQTSTTVKHDAFFDDLQSRKAERIAQVQEQAAMIIELKNNVERFKNKNAALYI